MTDHGFVEVETPVLHVQAGGAAARPFETHHNSLDMPLTLRIALELHLKRLLVGGLERVFEIGRVFRNEGLSTRHNPEFTMLECYQAFADYTDMMTLTEELVAECAAVAATGSTEVTVDGNDRSISPAPWPRRPMLDLIREHAGVDVHPSMPVDDARDVCARRTRSRTSRRGIRDSSILELYEKLVEPEPDRAGLRLRLPAERLAARAPPPRRPGAGRALRGGGAGTRARQRVQRAQRSRRPARALRSPGQARGRRRRGGARASTRTTCGRSSTACRRAAASVSASIAW